MTLPITGKTCRYTSTAGDKSNFNVSVIVFLRWKEKKKAQVIMNHTAIMKRDKKLSIEEIKKINIYQVYYLSLFFAKSKTYNIILVCMYKHTIRIRFDFLWNKLKSS